MRDKLLRKVVRSHWKKKSREFVRRLKIEGECRPTSLEKEVTEKDI
jgi:hypothetical protein